MSAIASQITSLTIVYSTVYSDADQRKHQSSTSLAFVRGIHRGPVNSRTNGQKRGKCFHSMTSSRISEINSFVLGVRVTTLPRVIDRFYQCGIISVFFTYVQLGCSHWCGTQLASIIFIKISSCENLISQLTFSAAIVVCQFYDLYILQLCGIISVLFIQKNVFISINVTVIHVADIFEYLCHWRRLCTHCCWFVSLSVCHSVCIAALRENVWTYFNEFLDIIMTS